MTTIMADNSYTNIQLNESIIQHNLMDPGDRINSGNQGIPVNALGVGSVKSVPKCTITVQHISEGWHTESQNFPRKSPDLFVHSDGQCRSRL